MTFSSCFLGFLAVLLLAHRQQTAFLLLKGTATVFCILNETISISSLHKLPVIYVHVLLPLVRQIDHMVQNHPAYNQVQAQAQQRWVGSINVDLLKQLLAQS